MPEYLYQLDGVGNRVAVTETVRVLAFETIDRGDWAGDFWSSEEPGLVIATPEDDRGL